jgi:putative hydrolase of HD superfamily
MDEARFRKQIDFIVEADKIKNIVRRSRLFDGSRFENDAEHSWTISLMALMFREYANFPVNVERVVLMLLVHDIVEVDAGDTFLYAPDRAAAHEREERAAKRIFGLLEGDQSSDLYDIWIEFEERKTNEAKFAGVFDRFEPLLQNYLNEGFTWKKNGVTKRQVLEMNRHVAEGSAEIWDFLTKLIDESVAKGYLAE